MTIVASRPSTGTKHRSTAASIMKGGGKPKASQATEQPHPRRRKTDREVDRKPVGVGAYVSGLLLKGKSTDEVLKLVERQFPDSATTRASVAWYRSKLKAEGKLS